MLRNPESRLTRCQPACSCHIHERTTDPEIIVVDGISPELSLPAGQYAELDENGKPLQIKVLDDGIAVGSTGMGRLDPSPVRSEKTWKIIK